MQAQDYSIYPSYNGRRCEVCNKQMYFDEETGTYYCKDEANKEHEE